MRKDYKVSIIASIITFLLIFGESRYNGNSFESPTQMVVISIGVGFTAYLAMNSWFKEKQS